MAQHIKPDPFIAKKLKQDEARKDYQQLQDKLERQHSQLEQLQQENEQLKQQNQQLQDKLALLAPAYANPKYD